MPTYTFACGSCGERTDQVHPMASIPDEVDCAACGRTARRTIASPRLGVGNTTAMRLQDATRATADTPAVVSSLPGPSRRPTPVTTNPLHRRLPRP